MLVKGCVVIIGFPCTTILLTNSAASLRILGTLNGFATAFSGLGRAAGPAMTGAVFTIGVRKGYMIFPWWLLAVVSLVGAIPVWFIVDGPGPTPAPDTDDDEDGDEEEEEEDNTLDGAEDEAETRFITSSEDLILMEPEELASESDSDGDAFKLPSQVRMRPVSAGSQSVEHDSRERVLAHGTGNGAWMKL